MNDAKPKNLQTTGQGPHVVLVNGLYHDASAWQPLVNVLRHRQRVTTFDFPQPRAGAACVSFAEQLACVKAVLAQLGGDSRDVVLIGLSGGANVARHLHAVEGVPLRGLVLIGASPGNIGAFIEQLHFSYVQSIQRWGIAAFWRASLHMFYSPQFFQSNPGVYEIMVEHQEQTFVGQESWLCSVLHPDTQDPNVDAPATQFSAPTLLLRGDQDALLPRREMLRYVASCQGAPVVYDELAGGHVLPFECPDETVRRIRAYLTSLGAPPIEQTV